MKRTRPPDRSRLDSDGESQHYTIEWDTEEAKDENHVPNELCVSPTPLTESVPAPPTIVTPMVSQEQSEEPNVGTENILPNRYIGVQIAKRFGTQMFLGEVTDIYDDGIDDSCNPNEENGTIVFYHIEYEDGDAEDLEEDELQEAMALYSTLPKRRKQTYEEGFRIATPLGKSHTLSFGALYDKATPIHTLILGTHPGKKSLKENRYFVHPRNAFWWIAGDCLGFRRDKGETKSGGRMRICADLRYDDAHIIPYEEQVNILSRNGFALWDIIASCKRKGSLDSAIRTDTPNDIREFVKKNPTIRRIVFSGGKSTLAVFKRHFEDWWDSGELILQETAQEVSLQSEEAPATPDSTNTITCICAVSVSPAAATITYKQKRDFWDKFVYSPGLKLTRSLLRNGSVLHNTAVTSETHRTGNSALRIPNSRLSQKIQ